MNSVKSHILKHKRAYALLIAVFIVVSIVLSVGKFLEKDDAVLIEDKALSNTSELAKAIDVSEKDAENIKGEISKVQTQVPLVTYYVQAPDVKTAAKQTQQAIKNKSESLPVVVTAKSDRTVVTPNEQQQKVDVYKINLNKAHKIKAGITVIDDKSYATVGYQAGKFEGLVHLKGEGKVKGATVLYTVAQW